MLYIHRINVILNFIENNENTVVISYKEEIRMGAKKNNYREEHVPLISNK